MKNQLQPGFDVSLLPVASQSFVVLSDTHFMLDPGAAVEFPSRRKQGRRAQVALQLVASMNVDFVVHLGDLVQAVPESPEYDQAMSLALGQFADVGVAPYFIPGNQDIGDKPDPTMPQAWVTPASLAAYENRVGPTWRELTVGGRSYLFLNSQILNSEIPERVEQLEWLESRLANTKLPTIVFLHLSPFLFHPDEPGFGHYDNISEPDRSWLLELLSRHRVEALFAGHSHFRFFNRLDQMRLYVAPSTSHTRPGFSELFSSMPPPEQGRDDRPKLGFLLARIVDGRCRVHNVRTNGSIAIPRTASAQLVTRHLIDLPGSPLGIDLRHPLAPFAEVPVAWPSAIRQPVRNDYPFLQLLELGARSISIPASDLDNPTQIDRIAALRDEGVRVRGIWLWDGQSSVDELIEPHLAKIDEIQLKLVVDRSTESDQRRWIRFRALAKPLIVTPLFAGERIPGKQLPRMRTGTNRGDFAQCQQILDNLGINVDRLTIRLDPMSSPWDQVVESEFPRTPRIRNFEWLLELGKNADLDARRAAEAMFGIAATPLSTISIGPYVELDRTMDASNGLLDRQCNPRAAFHVLRCLNTILFGEAEHWIPVAPRFPGGVRAIGLEGQTRTLWLLLPPDRRTNVAWAELGDRTPIVYRLIAGTSIVARRKAIAISEPTVICFPR